MVPGVISDITFAQIPRTILGHSIIDGKITYHLFSTSDQAAHARMKRPIVKYYSMSSILNMEPQMNDVITDFCRHLEDRFMEGSGRGNDFDFGKWIAYYTWDLISCATFSKPFGYMEKGYDFDKTIYISDQVADYTAMVGQMPFLDFLLDKNPIKRIGPPNLGNVTDISMRNLVSRMQGPEAEKKTDSQKDFLDHFLEAKQKSPDVVDNKIILGYLQVNMLAGADTTAITLRAIFDYLITTPRAMKRLEEEILAADLDPSVIVPYNTARSMPYLEGVIRESMRMHPGVGMLLERYVPETGVTLPDGSFLPSGVGVGISPYVVGRNKTVWGDNADTFCPERWLQAGGEDTEAYQQRLRKMNAADLTFGNGSRICIGRNIALLEVYKVVPTILLRYKVLPCDAKYDFKIISSWFSRQSGLVCKLAKRQVSPLEINA
ncbi:benzoate 4-monooxygenase cytochrome p450 [Ophiostoma piceae UAMH 11346]|uniref:Benzoate 4-monooxygenase cytochrome p450 n=1 Tax=Ophiostoma piceae (strain UAMH 11346) TaxID=1262450 RepID=S3BTS3_OPHP1|nr:benzoate 4-monooxygenase cytochrome p450 [Ophiostoma piceae UAMH 11346]